MQGNSSEGWTVPTAVLIVVATMIFLAWSAARTNFLNCDVECGEAVLALNAASEYAANGAEFGLLENLGSSKSPLIYTHNVNIGSLTFVGLEALGVPGKWKMLLPLAAFGLGLFYVFLTVRRAGGSNAAALLTLVLFATTYWTIGAFALHALRAWHLLAFLAVAFHTLGLVRVERSIADYAGLLFGALIAFGCGYDFWIICGAVSVALVFAAAPSLFDRATAHKVAMIGAAFAVPFLLRQVHVAYVMGPAYWLQDFIYSVAIKVPYASSIISIPSLDEIDAYYRSQHVLRPRASPSNSAAQIFFTFRHMVTSITVPRWGWLSLLMLAAVVVAAFVKPVRSQWLGTYSARLIVPMTVGVALGLAIFAPFSLHVYFKHEFPLVGFLLLLAKGALVYSLVRWVITLQSNLGKALAAAAVALIVTDHVMVRWNNNAHGPALNYEWTEAYARWPNENIALSVYHGQLMVVAYPYVGILPQRTSFVEADEVLAGRLTPQIWVYQPTQRFVDFDNPYPRCDWTDWLTSLMGWPVEQQPGKSCIYGQPRLPGAVLQESIDDVIARAKDYDVVGRSDRGIGYVILRRRAGT